MVLLNALAWSPETGPEAEYGRTEQLKGCSKKKITMQDSSTKMPENAAERSPFEDADLYDALFSSLRYDLDFYLELTQKVPGPVLEVACGTGRDLLPCLQAGVDIEGLDLYPAMLEVL